MEKRTPHYSLARMKQLIHAGAYRVTASALETAFRDFRMMEAAELAEFILELERDDFYKSMTTHHDAKHWQDVYHARVVTGQVYVKLQIHEDSTVIISFKLR